MRGGFFNDDAIKRIVPQSVYLDIAFDSVDGNGKNDDWDYAKNVPIGTVIKLEGLHTCPHCWASFQLFVKNRREKTSVNGGGALG